MRISLTVRARAVAMAIAVCTLVVAVQSCGVFSSGNCADKAICGTTDAGSDEGGSDGVSSADVADVGPDAPDEDDGDASVNASDVANGDRTSEDVGDVASEDAPFLAPDGCPYASCADAGCPSGSTCAPPVPSGWTGPALLWTGPSASAVPKCPAGYQDAFDANADPTGSAGTCSCTCSASGQSCSQAVVFNGDAACLEPCGGATVSTACTVVSTTTCGSTISMNASAPAPSGGGCTALVMMTNGSTAGWQTAAHVCSLASTLAGNCGAEACVPAPSASYPSFCAYHSGSLSCPAGYPHARVFYSGQSDTRDCGPCTCSALTGGSCSGTISVYGISIDCTAANPATYTLGSNCRVLNVFGAPPSHVQGNFVLSPGSCTVQSAATPIGAVTGTGPTTVCCM
jgi:hypothetical protein